ncbi:MAG: hypothetical protein ABIQ51_17500 [Mesorhizobium sp.]
MIVVRIRFHDWQKSDLHRIHNFGEGLWRAFRHNKRVRIDIGEIDRCTDEITFSVRGAYLRRAVREAETVMREHMVENEAVIVVEEQARPSA